MRSNPLSDFFQTLPSIAQSKSFSFYSLSLKYSAFSPFALNAGKSPCRFLLSRNNADLSID
ncbi:hypothetical protein NEOC84_001984|nr:hypothetical protein [Neochlamydia sp. AcF95]NGY96050.1 hypothetical protein [Neochlamydia sp. AcF84]